MSALGTSFPGLTEPPLSVHGALVASQLPFPVHANLLGEDLALYDLYMKALSRVLKDPEIRDGFDFVGVKPLYIRMEMLRDAEEIFATMPSQYNTYRLAHERVRLGLDASVDLLITAILGGELKRRLAAIGYIVTIAVGSTALISKLTGWGNVGSAVVPTLLVSGLALLGSWVISWPAVLPLLDRLHTLMQPVAYLPRSGWVARRTLIAAVEENELAAQMRQRINALRENRFDHAFGVVGRPELSEAFDSAYHVPTVVARNLDDLLGRLSGASIGIAGSRGSGKSTLIRRYCEDPIGSVFHPE